MLASGPVADVEVFARFRLFVSALDLHAVCMIVSPFVFKMNKLYDIHMLLRDIAHTLMLTHFQ